MPASDAADAFHLHYAVGEDVGHATDTDGYEVEAAQPTIGQRQTMVLRSKLTYRFCISLLLYQHVIK